MPSLAESRPSEFRVHRATDGQLLSTCDVGQEALSAAESPTAVFSRDGRTLAVAGGNGQAKCFETYSGLELFRVDGVQYLRALTFAPDGRTLFVSLGGEDQHSQAVGHDATGGAWGRPAVARLEDVERLRRQVGDRPATARKAVYHLATRPPEAIAFAREVTKLPTAADSADYARWLRELDAPAYADREAATKGLARAGWRAEAVMQATLDTTASVEARNRLEKLLAKRDVRPLRAVHLLELVASPEAVGVLKAIAAGPPESLVVQDAKWTLWRLENRPR